MPPSIDDPLSRALAALEAISGTDPASPSAEAWKAVRGAVLEAQRSRTALLAVARESQALLKIIDGFASIPAEEGVEEITAVLGEASEAATQALADALTRFGLVEVREPLLPGEAALWGVLSWINGEEQLDTGGHIH